MTSSQMLEAAREAFYGIAVLPLPEYVGIVCERTPDGEPSVQLPPKRGVTAADGEHAVTALYTLAEVASGVRACDAVWPQAIERERIPIVVTVSVHFSPCGTAYGTINAHTELAGQYDEALARLRAGRRATLEVDAELRRDDGEPVARLRASFYVRWMSEDRSAALTAGVAEAGGR